MNLTDSLVTLSCAASVAAVILALLAYLAVRGTADDLTVVKGGQLLRDETEIIRGGMDSHCRGIRLELVHLIAKFQEAIFSAFGGLREGIESQVKYFSGRLDSGVLSIDQKTDGIASKLTTDMEKMRSDAITNRDNLRTLLEQKLDQNLAGHAEAAKSLKDELSGNFDRLGARGHRSLWESSLGQNERLGSVTTALVSLSERLEKAQEGLRNAVDGRLETIRTDNAAKLEQMRATVEEKLHDTLEQRLASSFKVVSEQLEQRFPELVNIPNYATPTDH